MRRHLLSVTYLTHKYRYICASSEDSCLSTMSKRKSSPGSTECGSVHFFSDEEVDQVRQRLLDWYDQNKRDLPWRRQAKKKDNDDRGYAVWVSEIMLQQTQVATVIDYYNKWMKKWPTIESLSKANLEEVNEVWSGLGYYSRGRRLHEGAVKVINELNGKMPCNAEDLQKQLPGVGRYTAGAIASIAYGQATGLVDGNVIRLFSRMRIIGADSSSQQVTDAFWSIANKVVDPDRPGDFNQSLMELGATVCTPKAPTCHQCPVKPLCKAYSQVESDKLDNAAKLGQTRNDCGQVLDIECAADGCKLCLPADQAWDKSLGVMNYPQKGKKKAPREERTAVCVISQTGDNDMTEYLIVQRPSTGLLANLWEFPSCKVEMESIEKQCRKLMDQHLLNNFSLKSSICKSRQTVGEVIHIFSHIHQTYVVETLNIEKNYLIDLDMGEQQAKWVTRQQFLDAAVSTAMKKVFKSYESCVNGKDSNKVSKRKKGTSGSDTSDGKKQTSLDSFFKSKPAKAT